MMTKFLSLTKALLRDRLETAVKFFGFYIVGTIALCTYLSLFEDLTFSGWSQVAAAFSFLASFVLLIVLNVQTSRSWYQSTYRLIPVSSTKLYTANLLTSFISFICFGIATSIFSFILNPSLALRGLKDMPSDFPISGYFELTFVIIFGIIWIWVFVSLISLLTNVISNYLPKTGQAISRVVLVFAMLFLSSYLTDSLGNLVSSLFDFNAALKTENTDILVHYTLAMIIFWDVIVSCANVYLIKNWADISPKSN